MSKRWRATNWKTGIFCSQINKKARLIEHGKQVNQSFASLLIYFRSLTVAILTKYGLIGSLVPDTGILWESNVSNEQIQTTRANNSFY